MSGEPRGFTLFEIMAALAIFMLGIMGILTLLTTAMSLHKEALDRETTAMASAEVLAEIDALATALPRDPETGKLKPIVDQGVPGRADYFYSVEFLEAPDGGPVEARVSLSWKRGGQRRVVEFVSYVSVERPFEDAMRASKPKSPDPFR